MLQQVLTGLFKSPPSATFSLFFFFFEFVIKYIYILKIINARPKPSLYFFFTCNFDCYSKNEKIFLQRRKIQQKDLYRQRHYRQHVHISSQAITMEYGQRVDCCAE